MKRFEVRISGLGGQGVVLAGQVLGKAAVYDGKNAVQTQSYGAEARGSMAKSEVIIADSKIGYPEVRKCDILIAMSQEALDKNLKDLKKSGILLVDSTCVKKIPETTAKIFKVDATENAQKICGSKIYANMLMLGALTTATCITTEEAMKKAIEDTIAKNGTSINKQAYGEGEKLI